MRGYKIFILCLCALLFGCSSKDPEAREKLAFADRFVANIQARNLLAIEPMMATAMNTLEIRSNIRSVVGSFPRAPAKQPMMKEKQRLRYEGRDITRYVYFLDYDDNDTAYFAVVTIGAATGTIYRGESYEVIGFYVFPRKMSDIKGNEIEFEHLRVGQGIILLVSVVFPLIACLCFVACFFSSLAWKQKLSWLVAILIGYPQISYNWLTGGAAVNFLGLQVPMVAFYRIEQWLDLGVWVGFPLAAVIYWRKYPADVRKITSFAASLPKRIRTALSHLATKNPLT
tara:strand:+ start:2994 stop:3848 length:855 start_codon:yes stop_codon:yes gene_type:complete